MEQCGIGQSINSIVVKGKKKSKSNQTASNSVLDNSSSSDESMDDSEDDDVTDKIEDNDDVSPPVSMDTNGALCHENRSTQGSCQRGIDQIC